MKRLYPKIYTYENSGINKYGHNHDNIMKPSETFEGENSSLRKTFDSVQDGIAMSEPIAEEFTVAFRGKRYKQLKRLSEKSGSKLKVVIEALNLLDKAKNL